ncbi:class F sortase [Streptomyces sp. NPDC053079]|uniref:class F sortase n=1 Tax=Streptomyces sp. NPDC053079 TaxID=3365697 RepID=UPI0037CD971D
MSEVRTGGYSRLLTRVAWAALLTALWLLGNGNTEEPITTAPKTGDVATAGRPPAHSLPPAHEPLPGAGPQALVIKALGLRAPIEAHGLDALGGVEAPPYERPNAVAWYQDGPQPGSSGAAVLVGHVDTKKSPAVFYELSNVKRGQKINVTRTDGTVAEFTVESVTTVENDKFDADKVYGAPDLKRAELRLITCGGDYNRAQHEYTANVVVSAYLTGAGQLPPSTRMPRAPGTGPGSGLGSDPGTGTGSGSGSAGTADPSDEPRAAT